MGSMREHFMVIVPHQDDEVLMTAGVIRKAVKEQVPVEVVMATNGDYGCTDHSKGWERLRESIRGLEILGLDAAHFHILGYADTGMPAEESFLTHLYEHRTGCVHGEDRIWPSSCGTETYGLPEKEEYHMQRHGEHAPYCRWSFRSDLKEIIWEKRPTRIYTTSEFDLHGDHSGLYKFVCEVLDELAAEAGYAPELYVSVIHSCAGDENWPKRGTSVYDCPEGFEAAGGTKASLNGRKGLKWDARICLALPEEMCTAMGEYNLKRQALQQHETALEPNAAEYLMSFIKDEEIFWRIR